MRSLLKNSSAKPFQISRCRSRDIRTCAVAVTAATPDTLEAGCIIEFKTDTRQELALLQRPNGKSNWFATDVRYIGHTFRMLITHVRICAVHLYNYVMEH